MMGIPALHRVNAPAVAQCTARDRDRSCQRRVSRGGEDGVVDRQFQAQLGQSVLQRGRGLRVGRFSDT